ncbi:hypothetical protein EC991_004554 [Linnemannia zychae]|nr:hypothetical protein EC991_004554 [Linnemannia zychae]
MWNLRTRRGANSATPSPPSSSNNNNNNDNGSNNSNSNTTSQSSNNKNKRSRATFEAWPGISLPSQQGGQRVTRAKTFAAAVAAANANAKVLQEQDTLKKDEEDGEDSADDDDEEDNGADGDAEGEGDEGDDTTYESQDEDCAHGRTYLEELSHAMDDEDESDDSENTRLYRSHQEQGNSDEHGDDEFSSSDDMESDYEDEEIEWEVSEAEKGTDGNVEEEADDEDPELLDSRTMYLKRFRRHDDRDQDPGVGGPNTGVCGRGGCTGSRVTGVCGSCGGSASSSSSSRSQRYTTGLAGNNWTNHVASRSRGSSALDPFDSGDDRPRYHPEHRVVRQRINDMYRLLGRTENDVQVRRERTTTLRQTTTTMTTATAVPTTTSSPLQGTILSLSQALAAFNQPLTNVSELMDLLIQTHLPQFWRFREKSKRLNKYRNKPSRNTRPRFWDFLTTCVDCGYKIKKQPIYIETATERKVKARQRVEEKREKEEREELDRLERLERESRGEVVEWPRPEEKGATRKSRGPRKPVLAVSLSRDLSERFPSDDESYNYDDMGRPFQHPDQDLRPNLTYHRNCHLTHQNIDDIFNNNRHESTYDGNIDCIGVKEEGHSPSCPTNLSSTAKKATKLHFGWDLVVGFDHYSVPTFPNPRPTSVLTGVNSSSVPLATPPPPATGPNYYPARSLLAAFCHLLPRGLELTQNQIRKLFVYFIWHPWFDCDYQAITIRKGYKELWPLFLLRDEFELTPLEEEFESEVIKKTKEDKKAEMKDKKKAKDEEEEQLGLFQQPKRLRLDRRTRSATPSPPPSPLPLEPDPEALQALLNTMDPEERKLYEARIEEARRLQMEIRFTTSFERGLRNHGVLMESRNRTEKERMRNARHIRDGWVFGPRIVKIWEDGRQKDEVVDYMSDDGVNTDDEEEGFSDDDNNDDDDTPRKPTIRLVDVDCTKEPNNPGKTHIFRANNPREIRKGAHRDKDLTPPPPKVLYPESEIPRFFNNKMTRPKGMEDPLRWIREKYLDRWARAARRWRKEMKFVVPEFFRIKGGEDCQEEEDGDVEEGDGGMSIKVTKTRKKKPTSMSRPKVKKPAKARLTQRTSGDEVTATSASSPIVMSTTLFTRAQRQHQVELQQRELEHQRELQQQRRLQQQRQLEATNPILPANSTSISNEINTIIGSMENLGFPSCTDSDSGRDHLISYLIQPNSRFTSQEQAEWVKPFQQQQQQRYGRSNQLIQDNSADFVIVPTPIVDVAAQWESLIDVEQALMPRQQQLTPASLSLLASHPGGFLSYQQSTEPAMGTMSPASGHASVLTAIAQAHTQEQAQGAHLETQDYAAVSNFTQPELNLNDYISDSMDLYENESPTYNASSRSSSLSVNTYASGAMGNALHYGTEVDDHKDTTGLDSLEFAN